MSMESGVVMGMEVGFRMVMFKPCAVVDVDRCMCMDGYTHVHWVNLRTDIGADRYVDVFAHVRVDV